LYYTLYYDILSVLQNLFAIFYQLTECCSFAISWTRFVELVTWHGLYPWVSGSSLPYNLKP